MPTFQIGDRVAKNPGTWEANAFDEWGRGLGVGVVVDPPFRMNVDEVDVRWPLGRCFETTGQLLPAPSEFAVLVLRFILDDYENTVSIADNVVEEAGPDTTVDELAHALASLVDLGFADAFRYDSETNAFQKTILEGDISDVWYLANDAGRACADGPDA